MTEAEQNTQSFELATLAGGCFWGVEEILRKLPGVVDTRVGYTGGDMPNPTYDQVKTGTTGHAEAVEIRFNPERITYSEILGLFFRMHDPTTPHQQGNDVGSQYRSVIFFHSPKQEVEAHAVRAQVEQSGRWSRKIVTEIMAATAFYEAEDFHQRYLKKNPGGYTCHYLRD